MPKTQQAEPAVFTGPRPVKGHVVSQAEGRKALQRVVFLVRFNLIFPDPNWPKTTRGTVLEVDRRSTKRAENCLERFFAGAKVGSTQPRDQKSQIFNLRFSARGRPRASLLAQAESGTISLSRSKSDQFWLNSNLNFVLIFGQNVPKKCPKKSP